MKKIFMFLAVAMITVACSNKAQQQSIEEDTHRIDSLQRVLEQKDAELNDVMATFNEIQEGFRLIEADEQKVSIVKDGESTNKSEQIRNSVRNIQQRMRQNRELIAKLQKQVREGSNRSKELRKSVENFTKQLEEKNKELEDLRAELEQKNIHIAELDKTVADLNSSVSSLKEEAVKNSETISSQDKAINTAWYVFGTKKELKTRNIYNGGKVLQSNFDQNYFTKVDIRVDKEIKLYSKSAKILTSHPTSSYTLQPDAQKQYVLRITDPQKFWAASKYLVILIK